MSGPSAETPTLELHFQPAAFWAGPARGWLLVIILATVGIAVGTNAAAPPGWSDARHVPFLVAAAAVAGLVVAAVRAKTRPEVAAPLRVYTTHLELPEAAGGARTRRIEHSEILSLNVAGHAAQATLFLGTRERLFAYPQHAFVEPEAIEHLTAEVRRQLARQPAGAELLARMNLRDAIGRAAWATRPVATVILLLSIALGALVTWLGNVDDAPFGLVRYGANAPALVRDGQWFRLFAANFLHENFLHLYMNGLGLLTLGGLLERLIGPWRFTLIYLISALGGSLASALAARAALSVGASTAIFGLLGALAVLEWRFRSDLPGGFRQTPRWWFIILGLNAALPLLVPQIDVAAHGGGFLAGAATARFVCARRDSVRRPRPAPAWLRLLATLAIAMFAAALGTATLHAARASDQDQIRLEQAIVDDGSAGAAGLNAIAWQYAVHPSPSRAQLELARRAATSAAALEPESAEILDTLATVEYRQGHFDRAIELERKTLAERRDGFAFSQVARFLDSRRTRSGIRWIGADEATPPGVAVELSAEQGSSPKRELVLRTEATFPRGAEIWILAGEGAQLEGAFVLRLGPSERGELRVVPIGDAMAWEEREPTLFVALVDETGCPGCAAGMLEAEFRAMNAEARELPRATEMSTR